MAKKAPAKKTKKSAKPPVNWTVMVYMAAGDDSDLDGYAIRDLREMERVGSNENVNVVVQINRHWPAAPQRYHVLRNRSVLEVPNVPDTNMGSRRTLTEFLKWTHDNYEAQHYFLVLWGHAYGLGFGRDHDDPMTLPELRSALSTFRRLRGTPIDLLGANACAMSYAEAAFELKTVAAHLVASEIAVPFAGWPYGRILGQMGPRTSPVELGAIVVNSYVNQFNGGASDDQVSMTLLNLARAKRLKERLRPLAASVSRMLNRPDTTGSDRLAHFRTAFLTTAAGDVRPLIDLYDLSEQLAEVSLDLGTLKAAGAGSPGRRSLPLEKAARGMIEFLTPAAEQTEELGFVPLPENALDRFVVLHKRHPELVGLHGIGIFAPFVTDERDLLQLGLLDRADAADAGQRSLHREPKGRRAYRRLGLLKGTRWERLVYDELRHELPPELIACSTAAGATSRADRTAVSQMIASVDSVFDKLDRRIATTKLIALRQLQPGAGGAKQGTPDRARDPAQFAGLQLFPPNRWRQLLKGTGWRPAGQVRAAQESTPGATNGHKTTKGTHQTVNGFEALEQTIAQVERAVSRTLTHGRLGLGPGVFSPGPFTFAEGKPAGLGEGKPAGLGEGKPAGLGEGKPAGLGEGKPAGLGLVSTLDGAPTAASIVAELFERVGESLRRLEGATADLEVTAAGIVVDGSTNGASYESSTHDDVFKRRLERAFQVLAEASKDGRRTLRRVLGHPAYGFGPGTGIDVEERRELARLGGLNSRNLVLL